MNYFSNKKFYLLCLIVLCVSCDVAGMENKDDEVLPQSLLPEYLRLRQMKEIASFVERLNKEASSVETVDKQVQPEFKNNEIFVYSSDPNELSSEGVYFSQRVLEVSDTLKDMIEGPDSSEKIEIPLSYSNRVIKDIYAIFTQYLEGQDTLSQKNNITSIIEKYSLGRLIDAIDCIKFLSCGRTIEEAMYAEIKKRVYENNNIIRDDKFAELNVDVQKLLVVGPIKQWLKDLIIQKYAQKRKKIIVSEKMQKNNEYFTCAMFSADDSKIIFGHKFTPRNVREYLTICDLTGKKLFSFEGAESVVSVTIPSDDQSLIYLNSVGELKIMIGSQGYLSKKDDLKVKKLEGAIVRSVVVSPDGTKILVSSFAKGDNITMTEIHTDRREGTIKKFIGNYKGLVNCMAFNADSTEVVSGGMGDEKNVKIWDVSTLQAIGLTAQPNVYEVKFSPDTTKIVSHGDDGERGTNPLSERSLILWDIDDRNNITHKNLIKQQENFWRLPKIFQLELGYNSNAIAFSPDSSTMVSINYENNGNRILFWNISDYDHITHYTIPESKDFYYTSVAWSHDGKKLVTTSIPDRSWLADSRCNLTLWTLLTDEEDQILKQINNYDWNLLMPLYQMCLGANPIGNQNLDFFPESIKKLLSDLLWSSSLPSESLAYESLPSTLPPTPSLGEYPSLSEPLDILPASDSVILPDFINRWIATAKAWLGKKPQ